MKIPAKYVNKPLRALLKIAVKWCNQYIRQRDHGKPCVSCGKYTTLQAGHFYSAGKYAGLRFDDRNIHGQCLQCNYYGSMETGAAYERELRNRLGIVELERLHQDAARLKRGLFKWDRFSVIEKIVKFHSLVRGKRSR